jgi:hypothetical protein
VSRSKQQLREQPPQRRRLSQPLRQQHEQEAEAEGTACTINSRVTGAAPGWKKSSPVLDAAAPPRASLMSCWIPNTAAGKVVRNG